MPSRLLTVLTLGGEYIHYREEWAGMAFGSAEFARKALLPEALRTSPSSQCVDEVDANRPQEIAS
jgi:hypothetical protein